MKLLEKIENGEEVSEDFDITIRERLFYILPGCRYVYDSKIEEIYLTVC